MSGISGFLAGTSTLVVGVEDDEATGCLRMYVGSRSQGIYALVEDEAAKDELRRAWAITRQHLVVETPPAWALRYENEAPPADPKGPLPGAVSRGDKPR